MAHNKLISTTITAALCISLLSACTSNGGTPRETERPVASNSPADSQTAQMPSKPPREDIEIITTEPGEVIKAGTTFEKCNLLDDGTDQKGTFERVDYTTDAYEDGVTYEKYCNVYLPYGYDPKGEVKYDVVYFIHGNKNDPGVLTADILKSKLDSLFATGKVPPVILVFPTYYMDAEGDAVERQRTGLVPAGDGNWEGLPANFYLEIIEDVIPAVEPKYAVYTESFDEEGLIASRDHRCFSGYSRGGMCTWYMFHNALPYFKWYSPMSANCMAGETMGAEVTNEEAYRYLKEAADEHPDLDFFIYAASGRDNDAPVLRTQMAYFEQQELFSYGDDPTENNLFYTLSDFAHSDTKVPFYYYNTLQVIFQ